MSTEPRPGPDPFDDPPPRPRWVAPALIGLAIGILVGGAGIFIVISISNRSRTNELAAEKFNIQTVLSNTPGAETVSTGTNQTDYLGPTGRRANTGSAVHRRISLNGVIPPTTDVSALGNGLKTQVDAELARHGAFSSGGGSSSSLGQNVFTATWETTYYTRDGRRGSLDGEITISQGTLKGRIIITEGR